MVPSRGREPVERSTRTEHRSDGRKGGLNRDSNKEETCCRLQNSKGRPHRPGAVDGGRELRRRRNPRGFRHSRSERRSLLVRRQNGMDDAAETLGVTAEYLAPENFDMPKMAQMIDAAAASKPDGLVISIPDASALGEAGQERRRRGHSGDRHRLRRRQADQGARRPALSRPVRVRGWRAGRRAGQGGARRHEGGLPEPGGGNQSLDDRCAGFAEGLGVEVPVLQGVSTPPR